MQWPPTPGGHCASWTPPNRTFDPVLDRCPTPMSPAWHFELKITASTIGPNSHSAPARGTRAGGSPRITRPRTHPERSQSVAPVRLHLHVSTMHLGSARSKVFGRARRLGNEAGSPERGCMRRSGPRANCSNGPLALLRARRHAERVIMAVVHAQCEGTVVVHLTRTLTCSDPICAETTSGRHVTDSHSRFVACTDTLGAACPICAGPDESEDAFRPSA